MEILDSALTKCLIFCQIEENKNIKQKIHPNLDRKAWKQNQIFKPKGKNAFPALVKCPTVKYTYSSNNSNDIPFMFEYWANEGSVTFEVEFNSSHERFKCLKGLEFLIEIPAGEGP